MIYETSANCHHTTAETEAKNVRSLAFNVPICVIPNGVDIPKIRSNPDAFNDENVDRCRRKIALFLGADLPGKGLTDVGRGLVSGAAG